MREHLAVPVLGASLSKLLEFDGQTRTLPLILKNCLDALRDDDSILKSTTLFRAQPADALAKAISEFDSPNKNVNLLRFDADTSSLLLLEWLNNLPEGLVTEDRYHKFVASIKSLDVDGARPEPSPKLLRKLGRAVKSQSSPNTNALHYLLIFLREVEQNSASNGLTVDVLANIFGKALCRPNLSALASPQEEDEDAEADSGSKPHQEDENGEKKESTEEVAAKAARYSSLIVWTLLSGFATVFADLSVDDKETFPEDQLTDAAVQGKRASHHIRMSSSSSNLTIKKVVSSPSGENVAAGGTPPSGTSLSQTPSKESLAGNNTSSANSSSSNLAASSLAAIAASLPWPPPNMSGTLAPEEDSGSASASNTASTSFKSSTASTNSQSPADTPPQTRAKSGSKSSQDAGESEEREKKGLKGALRKLGFGGSKDKDKDKEKEKKDKESSSPAAGRSPSRGRSGSVAAPSPSTLAPQEELSPTGAFRLTFEKLLETEHGEAPRVIPNILRDCCEHLAQAERTKEFGIFRESGSFNEKARLKKAYDSAHVRIDFDATDGYTVAALVKEWLRAMPEALLTEKLYTAFKDAVAEDLEPPQSIELLAAAVTGLPDARRQCLHYLLHFMKTHVVAHQADNRMGESNVGIVLGPCLHRKQNPSSTELMDPCHNQIVVQLLANYDTIFQKWALPVPAVDSALTVYKKSSNLDRPVSVLDQINQSIAAENGGSGTTTPDDASSNSMDQRAASPDIKLSKTKKKSSGIFDMWDRVKEETQNALRRGRSGSEASPAAERHRLTRSASTKASPPSRESPSNSLVQSGASVSEEPSVEKPVVSPKASPRTPRLADSSRHNSESKLTIRTVIQHPDGSTSTQISTPSGAVAVLPVSGQNSPRSSSPSSARKTRSPRDIRTSASSNTDSNTAAPTTASESNTVSSLTAEQVESWLQENAFGDLCGALKCMTGAQLLSLSKDDLKSDLALRGVALWHALHPTATANSESSLAAQVAQLTAKIEELLLRIPPLPAASAPASQGSPKTAETAASAVVTTQKVEEIQATSPRATQQPEAPQAEQVKEIDEHHHKEAHKPQESEADHTPAVGVQAHEIRKESDESESPHSPHDGAAPEPEPHQVSERPPDAFPIINVVGATPSQSRANLEIPSAEEAN